VSLSSGDEAPHIFTRKSHLQPGEFLITSAKRLLQQNLPKAALGGQSAPSPTTSNGAQYAGLLNVGELQTHVARCGDDDSAPETR
jgi:hypothetical protein